MLQKQSGDKIGFLTTRRQCLLINKIVQYCAMQITLHAKEVTFSRVLHAETCGFKRMAQRAIGQIKDRLIMSFGCHLRVI